MRAANPRTSQPAATGGIAHPQRPPDKRLAATESVRNERPVCVTLGARTAAGSMNRPSRPPEGREHAHPYTLNRTCMMSPSATT
jgi:hypothetical protein